MKAKSGKGATLKQVVASIERIAPPELAEDWDNTGLLLSPSRGARIQRIMLTIDCSPAVAAEAVQRRCDCIISYHPPIFSPINRLSGDRATDRRLLRLIESRVAVYSPHTALDRVAGGVNDWLAAGVQGNDAAVVREVPEGPGRLVAFRKGIALKTLTDRVRRYLKVPYLRVARPDGRARPVRRVALCAGAGGSTLDHTDADALVTGEMKHHDLLAANARGVTVILSEHTHTERGYLPVLKKRLARELPDDVSLLIARTDRDPVSLLR